jgi:hypothetical protein
VIDKTSRNYDESVDNRRRRKRKGFVTLKTKSLGRPKTTARKAQHVRALLLGSVRYAAQNSGLVVVLKTIDEQA